MANEKSELDLKNFRTQQEKELIFDRAHEKERYEEDPLEFDRPLSSNGQEELALQNIHLGNDRHAVDDSALNSKETAGGTYESSDLEPGEGERLEIDRAETTIGSTAPQEDHSRLADRGTEDRFDSARSKTLADPIDNESPTAER